MACHTRSGVAGMSNSSIPQRLQRIEQRRHDCGRCAGRAGLAATLHAERIGRRRNFRDLAIQDAECRRRAAWRSP